MSRYKTGKRPVAELAGLALLSMGALIAFTGHADDPRPSGERVGAYDSSASHDFMRKYWDRVPEPRLRVNGLIPSGIAEELNSETGHLGLAREAVAAQYSSYDMGNVEDPAMLEGQDFIITSTSAELALLKERGVVKASETLARTPVILVAPKDIAEKLGDKGIVSPMGSNYSIDLKKLHEEVLGTSTWAEAGLGDVHVPVKYEAFPATGNRTGAAMAEAIAAESGVELTTSDAATAAAVSSAELIDFVQEDRSCDLLEHVVDPEQFGPRIVAISEADLIYNGVRDDFKRASVALMYPTSSPELRFSYVALTDKGVQLMREHRRSSGGNVLAWEFSSSTHRNATGTLVSDAYLKDSPYKVPPQVRVRQPSEHPAASVAFYDALTVHGSDATPAGVIKLERPANAK